MRPWTAKEVQFLKQQYQLLELSEIAKALNRSVWSVYTAARRRKLTVRASKATQQELWTIVQMWERGRTCPMIAESLRWSPSKVKRYCRRLGLTPNTSSSAAKEQLQKAHRRQASDLGLRSIGQLPALASRRQVVLAGWPHAETMAEVKILNLLEVGESDLQGLRDGLGRKSLDWIRCVTNRLCRRGLVERRKMNRCWLYSLSPRAKRRGV